MNQNFTGIGLGFGDFWWTCFPENVGGCSNHTDIGRSEPASLKVSLQLNQTNFGRRPIAGNPKFQWISKIVSSVVETSLTREGVWGVRTCIPEDVSYGGGTDCYDLELISPDFFDYGRLMLGAGRCRQSLKLASVRFLNNFGGKIVFKVMVGSAKPDKKCLIYLPKLAVQNSCSKNSAKWAKYIGGL